MSECVFLYVTTANEKEASMIARVLVEERLVACVNMMAPVRSFFNWQGQVREETEVVFVAKTTCTRADAVIKRVKQLHSYDVPAIVALPIEAGEPSFLKWVIDTCD